MWPKQNEPGVVQALDDVLTFPTVHESASSPSDGLVDEVENDVLGVVEVGVEHQVHLYTFIEVFREPYRCL